MDTLTYVNGQPATAIDIHDRGCMYGDGVFETLLACQTTIPLWERHIKRLHSGCQRLNIGIPDTRHLWDIISPHLAAGTHRVIKIVVTRGSGARGYRINAPLTPNVTISISDRQFKPTAYWQQGVAVFRCQTTLAEQPALAGIKHLNRLEQILASQEWDEHYQEGLMCSASGQVIEATYHNVFAVRQGMLFTPDVQFAGVAGVMREYVIELAREWQIPVYIQPITYTDLQTMTEGFLTNSINGIWPINRIAEQTFAVGTITRKIQNQVAELIPYQ